jgi:DNA recombination protein RmuC
MGNLPPEMILLAASVSGLVVGALLSLLLLRRRVHEAEARGRQESAPELAQLRERVRGAEETGRRSAEELRRSVLLVDELRGQLMHARETLAREAQRCAALESVQAELEAAKARVLSLSTGRAELEAQLNAEKAQVAEKLALLQGASDALTNQFKVLANQILEEKSQKFTEQNRQNLDVLLEPLKLQLTQFKGKVEEVYVNETKDRVALREQVQQLLGLNQQLSKDAHDLTQALRGSNKAQGNWGELVLERILESAALRRGVEYDVQESHTREDGSRAQPDLVLHLPEDKHLILDSKVSLVSYQEAVAAEDEEVRTAALRRHLDSLRAHIRGLSAKDYPALYGVKTVDFVIMFVPVEPAYSLAIQSDADLWAFAWERNVLLVGPSTLMFVVRTVAQLLRQDQQNKNALEIARRGAELYQKLVAFVEDLLAVGERLGQAQTAYERARKRLSEGRGNVIRQAELLRELGVKPNKSLPAELVEGAGTDPLPASEERKAG